MTSAIAPYIRKGNEKVPESAPVMIDRSKS